MVSSYYNGKLNNVFVSQTGYPNISMSLLLKNDPNQKTFQSPNLYRRSLLNIPGIVDERKKLINSYFKTGIFERSSKINDVHLMTMASKPADVEVDFLRRSQANNLVFDTDNVDIPIPRYNPINSFKLTSNVPLIKPVEKIYYDKDITTNDAYSTLYDKLNIYRLIDMFSVGLFGKKLNKKIVPTKWSITANDDIASKKFLAEVIDFPKLRNYELYYSHYLGNHYVTLLLPTEWSYELFEFGVDGVINSDSNIRVDEEKIDIRDALKENFKDVKSSYDKTKDMTSSLTTDNKIMLGDYMTDYESHNGRKQYASNCVGGYYAVRYSIARFLFDRKKQGSALTLRFVDKTYNTPMGVWVCREASNFDMAKCLGFFDNIDAALTNLNSFVMSLNIVNANDILKKSILLQKHRFQRRIMDYI